MPSKPRQIPVLFRYIGSKWTLSDSYPPPTHDTIVEPFAGSAGYSLRFGITRDVVLVDGSPPIVAAWKFLIGATRKDVLGLPLQDDIPFEGLRAMDLPEGAKALIGFNLVRGRMPNNTPTGWSMSTNGKGFWCESKRRDIADHLRYIRHWRVIDGNYDDAPDIKATWFVDPPYQSERLRGFYGASLPDFDYAKLAAWVRSRRGQVIACDEVGADWLPFRPLRYRRSYTLQHKSNTPQVREAVWTRDQP